MWSIIWKVLIGIGVIIGVIGGVWTLDGHWATCQMVAQIEQDTIHTLQSMKTHTDLRTYDFAIQSLTRDYNDENCQTIQSPKCEKYANERQVLQNKRDKLFDQLAIP